MGIRINALTETTSPGDTDNGVLDTSAGTRRITWANIKAAIFGAINGLTSKSTPVGADVIAIGDSAASFAGKKSTLTELRKVSDNDFGTWVAHTVGGYGSTANKIPYFNTVVTNNPNSKFTITNNNSTNGLAITINVPGLYAITYWSTPSGAQYTGLSLNASSVTDSITSIAAAQRISLGGTNASGYPIHVSTTRYFAANDVIRPHNDGAAFGTAALTGFAIEYIKGVA